MSTFLDSLGVGAEGLLASTRWMRVVNLMCAVGTLAALASAWVHWRRARASEPLKRVRQSVASMLALGLLVLAIGATSLSVWSRYVEVNHFPSQTMSEVLVMFSSALLVSMLVLHGALKLGRLGPGWAIVDDALLGVVFAGAWATNAYTQTLSTAQRDLPPALQSYWFPPHLSALIFSYATLGIAGAVALVYFATRFWSGVFSGGHSRRSQWIIGGFLVLVPFAQMVTLPIVILVGVVFAALKWTGRLPDRAALAGMERTMDEVSYRAFSVGIPFLTAGVFMGAFWAQEAWANYWGWDSKENSALITWLVYVAYIHLRMLGGYRGEKAMGVLAAGALSVFLTFQIFGYLPDSQKSLHRYTDDGVTPREGMQGAAQPSDEQARVSEDER